MGKYMCVVGACGWVSVRVCYCGGCVCVCQMYLGNSFTRNHGVNSQSQMSSRKYCSSNIEYFKDTGARK